MVGGGRFVRLVCYMHREPGIVIGSFLFNSHNPHTLMKTTKIGERAVVLYDSIDELPILRFHAYNKMLLIDAGVGSVLNDCDAPIEKSISFIR